ncbi:hypothetical protein [Ureibacillus sinduriensis]|uniref:hypothetical protein n=1 Tax=Ureibacillus sinduriensis TaxID=561440 RepID=UPI00068BFB85|nr:hypothetical protein [Ureibacillus sinduriensis]
MNKAHEIKEYKIKITGADLKRFTGFFAILAGILYIAIQFIHPSENIASVAASSWVVVSCLSIAMSLFFLVGTLGIYTVQVEQAGWIGLIGYLSFSLFWLISMIFSFVEAFVLPLLINDAPKFVVGILGLFGENKSEVNLGIFTQLAPIAGVLYMLGGLLLGIAIFRAKVFPRFAGLLLSFAAVVTLATAIIPHPFDRLLALPMGVALIWLGCICWLDTKDTSKQ